MKPFYSVILPIYNAAATLAETLDSLLAQDYPSFEICAVNDGSSDGSRAILEAYREQHPALSWKIVDRANGGLGAARNAGVAVAEGDFCALLDADDRWHPNKLSRCAQYLERERDTALLYHPVRAFGGDRKARNRGIYPVVEIRELLLKGNPLVPSGVIIARDLLWKEAFSEDLRFHGAEDLELWMRLLHAGHPFQLWPEVLADYRRSGGMSSNLEEHLQHVFAVLRTGYERGYYWQSDLEAARQRKYYEAGRMCQKRGDHHEANRYFSAADAKSMKLLGLRFLNGLGIRW